MANPYDGLIKTKADRIAAIVLCIAGAVAMIIGFVVAASHGFSGEGNPKKGDNPPGMSWEDIQQQRRKAEEDARQARAPNPQLMAKDPVESFTRFSQGTIEELNRFGGIFANKWQVKTDKRRLTVEKTTNLVRPYRGVLPLVIHYEADGQAYDWGVAYNFEAIAADGSWYYEKATYLSYAKNDTESKCQTTVTASAERCLESDRPREDKP